MKSYIYIIAVVFSYFTPYDYVHIDDGICKINQSIDLIHLPMLTHLGDARVG